MVVTKSADLYEPKQRPKTPSGIDGRESSHEHIPYKNIWIMKPHGGKQGKVK